MSFGNMLPQYAPTGPFGPAVIANGYSGCATNYFPVPPMWWPYPVPVPYPVPGFTPQPPIYGQPVPQPPIYGQKVPQPQIPAQPVPQGPIPAQKLPTPQMPPPQPGLAMGPMTSTANPSWGREPGLSKRQRRRARWSHVMHRGR